MLALHTGGDATVAAHDKLIGVGPSPHSESGVCCSLGVMLTPPSPSDLAGHLRVGCLKQQEGAGEMFSVGYVASPWPVGVSVWVRARVSGGSRVSWDGRCEEGAGRVHDDAL